MGTRDDMLRKYLRFVGFAAIIFGVVFFILSITGLFGMLKSSQLQTNIPLWDKLNIVAQSALANGFAMFESLTLGGICLYLARRLERQTND